MKNMKIYINGKYSIKENIVHKAKMHGPVILDKIDAAFVRLYEV